MEYILLIAIIMLYFPITYTNKLCSKGTSEKIMLFKFSLFRAAFGIGIGIVILLIGPVNYYINTTTIFVSLLFGVMLATCLLLTFYAMQITTVTITTMFTAASVMLPICCGILFFKDLVTAGKIIGLVLFFISAYLIVSNTSKTKQRFGKKALLVCMGVMVTSGIGSIAIQLFARCVPNGNESLFMLLSYIVETLVLMVAYMFLLKKSHMKVVQVPKIGKKLMLTGVVGTIATFSVQQLQTSIAAKIPAIVQFPVIMGSSVIMGVVVGRVFFQEKLSTKNAIGVVMGICSLVLIDLF